MQSQSQNRGTILGYQINMIRNANSDEVTLTNSSCKTNSRLVFACYYLNLIHKINPFLLQLFYFISTSTFGFLILNTLKPRTSSIPTKLDLFFTSVSAATVSSMSTVEMEVFSNAQLVVMIVLMFIGGEIFTSLMGVYLKGFKIIRKMNISERKVDSESGFANWSHWGLTISENDDGHLVFHKPSIKYESIKFLGFIVLGYFLLVQFLGIASVLIYLSFVSSARNVLIYKGIKSVTFAVFLIVSTFSSCGFVPTNENMIIFKNNSGLLLILIPQVLLGSTLFPPVLRLLIWILGKKLKKNEAEYLLKRPEEVGYNHLLPKVHSIMLVPTVFGFMVVGFVLFYSLEWNSIGLSELSVYQKTVSVIFQCVNSRHSGESTFDLSTISSAILVFFVVMMYLPAYTSFIPVQHKSANPAKLDENQKNNGILNNLMFSQLSYLVIFIILICITERRSLKDDPLNFNLLSITLEVISAYGNVGFTTGYSCERQLKTDPNCVTKWYGFSGKWSDEGKIVLIIVMLFGRLKKFNMNGGQAWKLL